MAPKRDFAVIENFIVVKTRKMLTECNFSFSMGVRGWIAQAVEQGPEKPCVVGSTPTLATSCFWASLRTARLFEEFRGVGDGFCFFRFHMFFAPLRRQDFLLSPKTINA